MNDIWKEIVYWCDDGEDVVKLLCLSRYVNGCITKHDVNRNVLKRLSKMNLALDEQLFYYVNSSPKPSADIVKYLVDKGARIHIRSHSLRDIFIQAASKGCMDLVEYLLDTVDTENRNWGFWRITTAACYHALRYGQTDIAHRLLDAGAWDIRGLSIMNEAGHLSVIRRIISQSFPLSSLTSPERLLFEAALYGQPEVVRCLMECGVMIRDVDDSSYYKHCPLYWVAVWRDKQNSKYMLRRCSLKTRTYWWLIWWWLTYLSRPKDEIRKRKPRILKDDVSRESWNLNYLST